MSCEATLQRVLFILSQSMSLSVVVLAGHVRPISDCLHMYYGQYALAHQALTPRDQGNIPG